MSTTTLTTGAAPREIRGGVIGMLRDSWVVAKRNLRRMTRIPNRVRSRWLGFASANAQVGTLAWAAERGAA